MRDATVPVASDNVDDARLIQRSLQQQHPHRSAILAAIPIVMMTGEACQAALINSMCAGSPSLSHASG